MALPLLLVLLQAARPTSAPAQTHDAEAEWFAGFGADDGAAE